MQYRASYLRYLIYSLPERQGIIPILQVSKLMLNLNFLTCKMGAGSMNDKASLLQGLCGKSNELMTVEVSGKLLRAVPRSGTV